MKKFDLKDSNFLKDKATVVDLEKSTNWIVKQNLKMICAATIIIVAAIFIKRN
jgi:hypothetical protein